MTELRNCQRAKTGRQSTLIQCLLQISDQIFHVLNSHGDAHDPIGEIDRLSAFLTNYG